MKVKLTLDFHVRVQNGTNNNENTGPVLAINITITTAQLTTHTITNFTITVICKDAKSMEVRRIFSRTVYFKYKKVKSETFTERSLQQENKIS